MDLHPKNIVDKMYNNDAFSQWLGIVRFEDGAGISVLKMSVRKEMLNGFAILHGGICYSLADSALAFAANAHGVKSVSVETSISHIAACKEGDVLIARTEEMSLSHKIGVYHITITNQEHKTVALFKGTVYRTGKQWEL
jgi:acyl-CoA thioesterase